MSNETERLDRRSVLKRLGAAGAATVGTAGVASAEPTVDAAAARAGFASDAADVLGELADRGLLTAGSVTELDLTPRLTGELDAGREGVVATDVEGTRVVIARRDVRGVRVNLFYTPETGGAHAVIERDGTRERIEGDGQIASVTTSGSCDDYCYDDCRNDRDRKYQVYLSEDSDGSCSVDRYSCGCRL
ncbi:MAG: hypothetical protein ABEI75_05075 [Halobaculum sp.]